ncbi:class I SAM-dependent methyltransferase [Streptomyces sp. NPDC058157]|uniref:class I SAM-dependent methyltransferase n=1 Tax=Streptomyces sp. NPDC058157 TaxID=3346360 RepID=UPI0036E0B563
MTATSRPGALPVPSARVAADHAGPPRDEPPVRPLDRAVLDAFAAYARGAGGAVADVGCGPGHVTAYLERRGVRAFGVDLSPARVAVARRTYPGLRFEVGPMAALDVADGALGGVLSWYGTAHGPAEELPALFAEFARVLAPGGYVLIAFEAAGEGDAHGTAPSLVVRLLAEAGLAEVARVVREPDERERGPQGFALARKPPRP